MKKVILAALTVLSLGAGVASAATVTSHSQGQQQGNSFNFTQGGGG